MVNCQCHTFRKKGKCYVNSEKSLPEEWRRLVEEAMESTITKEEFKAFLIEVGQQKGITIA